MGDGKWTRRGPGSASGSFVPPPVVAAPEPRTRQALPRRWPKSDRRAAQASGGGADQTQSQPTESKSQSAETQSQSVETLNRPAQEPGQQAQLPGAVSAAAPGPPPTASLPASPSPKAASSPAGSPADAGTDPATAPTSATGSGQRRLQLAEPQAPATSPQLPDNVRYLFKPVLNQPADQIEPAEAAGTKAGTKAGTGAGTQAGTQKVDRDRAYSAGARSARDRATSAAFQQTATAPATDRLAEPDQSPETEPVSSPRPAAAQQQQQLQPQPAAAQAAQPAANTSTSTSTSPQPRWLAWLRADSTPAQDAPPGRTQLRRHLAWAAAVFLVVVTAVGTAFALVDHGTPTSRANQASAGSSSGRHGGRAASSGARALAGLSNAGITRARAAQWIVKEISPSAIIACDAVMCNQLINEGLPASNVQVLGPSAADPLGADIVVGTPALRSQFGSRLVLVYAPSVLASFGRGPTRIDIRVVAPDGAAAYQEAFTQDLENRQHYGDILLSNSKVTVSPEAKPDVVSGLVDARLLAMLPVLAAQHPIQILGFFDRAPGAGEGIPLSGVELAGSDDESGLSVASYQSWLLGFLHSQRAPYRPASITKAIVHGREVVFVRFIRPSPIGLLSGQ
jgi:hypothetical protein